MDRFWFFPLFLSMAGALTALVIRGETILSKWVGDPTMPVWLFYPTIEKWVGYGMIAGSIWGVVMAFFDWLCNRHRDRRGIDFSVWLIPNLWWCMIYGALINTLNILLWWLVLQIFGVRLQLIPHISWQWAFNFTMALVLNGGAVMWGSIRCVRCGNALSPRLLHDRLRCSTHVTG